MVEKTLLGAVLAGGRSRRFGGDKALAPFMGEPVILRPARALDAVCRDVVLVTRGGEPVGSPPYRTISDRIPDAGPLGGLHAALVEASDAGDEGVLLLACDMPLATPELLRRVAEEGRASGRPAAAPSSAPSGSGKGLEPFCAWYGVACLPVVERRLGEEDRSLLGLLAELEAHPIPRARLSDAAELDLALRGVNTPAELERLERLAVEALRSGAAARRAAAVGRVPPVVCVVGFKDSGKTGVAVGLAQELRRRGHRVAAIKHGHGFRPDTEGTDSWRLREEGGADPVLFSGPVGFALMGGWDARGEPTLEGLLRRYAFGADVVVAEGFKRSSAPKVEVLKGRPQVGAGPGGPGALGRSDAPGGTDGSDGPDGVAGPGASPGSGASDGSHEVGADDVGAERVHPPGDPGARSLIALVVDGVVPTSTSPAPVFRRNDPRLSEWLADIVEAEVMRK